MHPPIKTRLVGTQQGEGPGQERRGEAGRSHQAAAAGVCKSLRPPRRLADRCAHLMMDTEFGDQLALVKLGHRAAVLALCR